MTHHGKCPECGEPNHTGEDYICLSCYQFRRWWQEQERRREERE